MSSAHSGDDTITYNFVESDVSSFSALGTIANSGNISITATSGDLTLATATSGTLFIESVGVKESRAAHGKTIGTVAAKTMVTYVGGALVSANPSSHKFPAGLLAEADTDSVYCTPGEVYEVSETLSTEGAVVYWVSGGVSETAPSTSEDQIWRVGYTHSTGAGTSKVVWMPQFIGVV